MIVGVVKETFPGERRVALAPSSVPPLLKAGMTVRLEEGAGQAAGYPDAAFAQVGCVIVSRREEVLAEAEVVLQVRACGANQERWQADMDALAPDRTVVGMMDPLGAPEAVRPAAEKGLTLFSLELLPRITRAQSMDVLSSQANLAGYKAVLLAADALPKLFPMMMTAAGTITPSRVFVVGAGVAGLQAIATARRLGAVVSAYDVRPAVKEQVESLGARFAELDLEAQDAQDSGGYAKAMGEEFYRKQAEMMAGVLADSDAVITTAAVPGRKAPILVTRSMVEGMRPGSLIVDLAAERGGNCELTRPGEVVEHSGVRIIGPLNLASEVPYHASQLYGRNIATFLLHIARSGSVSTDVDDEITAGTLVAARGHVVHPGVREALGLAKEE